MTTPSDHDEPSTEIALRDEVQELRAELEQIRHAPRPPARVIRNELDRWVEVIADYSRFANVVANTDFVPQALRGKPEQVTAIMMYAREVGLPPMTGLTNSFSIKGKVGMYAEQLRAMIISAGHELTITESTSDRCVILTKRAGSERSIEVVYTMDEAKRAGYARSNDRYQTNPVDMLVARCTGRTAKFHYPDVIRGMGVAEEMEDEPDRDAPASAPAIEPAKKTVQRAAKKAAAKEITPGDDKAAEVFIPGAAKAGLPPLPGEEAAPVAPTDPPARRTESEIAKQGMRAQYTEESAELAGVVSEGSAAVNPGEGTGSAPDVPSPAADPEPHSGHQGCQETSGGQMCRYYFGHAGDHSFGGGLKDPVEHRHCPEYAEHSAHAWTGGGTTYACSGTQVQDAQGERSGPLTDRPRGITPADTRLLQARFKKLGYTDEPDDREARLMVATVLAGVEVETFSSGRPNSITRDQAQAILLGLAECANRDDVLELMVKRAQDARAEETGQ